MRHRKSCASSVEEGALNDTTLRNVGDTAENVARVVPSLPEQSMPCSTSSTAFARVAASFAVSSTSCSACLAVAAFASSLPS